MRLALFDIDGTLIPDPGSEPRFARYLLARGWLGPRQCLAYAGYVLRYYPRYRRRVFQKNKAYLAGLAVSEIAAAAADFVRTDLEPLLHEPTVSRLRQHLAGGDRVMLLSGTPQFIADPLAALLGAHGAYGSICAVRNGKFVAAPPLRHPFRETKVGAAGELAEAAGLSLADVVAYGDSINDTQLFHAVGRSIVVMPSRRLRQVAGGEGWDIMSS